jgi:hypothetical protein
MSINKVFFNCLNIISYFSCCLLNLVYFMIFLSFNLLSCKNQLNKQTKLFHLLLILIKIAYKPDKKIHIQKIKEKHKSIKK